MFTITKYPPEIFDEWMEKYHPDIKLTRDQKYAITAFLGSHLACSGRGTGKSYCVKLLAEFDQYCSEYADGSYASGKTIHPGFLRDGDYIW